MTGEKNRYKTLDKLAGLNDKQLATPKHDELVLFLLDKNNLVKVIPELPKWMNIIQKFLDTTSEEAKEEYEKFKSGKAYFWGSRERVKETLESLINLDLPKMKILSEVPIETNNRFIVGYWDIVIRLYREGYSYSIKGYKDLFYDNHIPKVIYIEVKPEVRSFGETLRQLNTYKSQEKTHGDIYLFTPDLRFKEQFEGQGIKVISPPEKQTKLDF